MNSKYIFLISVIFSGYFYGCRDTNNAEKESIETEGTFLFVGTYTRTEGHVDGKGEGIYIYEWDSSSTSLSHHMTISGIINPSYIALHPKLPVVYAVSEVANARDDFIGEVHAISYNLTDKTYQTISKHSSHGDAPCHLSMTSDAQHVLVANYVGGSIAVYSVEEDGSLSAASDHFKNSKKTPTTPRQEAAHAHMIRSIPGSKSVLVSDLGTDELLTYDIDNKGSLSKRHSIISRTLGGPRHFDFHPTLPYVYVLNELKPSISRFLIENNIPVRKIQQIDIPIKVEGDLVNSSAIKVHPKGDALYAAVRGLNGSDQNEMVVFSVDPQSHLSIIQTIPTNGQIPRDFIIDPSEQYLLTGNQDSGNVTIYQIEDDRRLQIISSDTSIPTPVCFAWK